jgi:hypothetical protein
MMDPGALEAKSALRLPDLEHAETAALNNLNSADANHPGVIAQWLESFFLYRASAL